MITLLLLAPLLIPLCTAVLMLIFKPFISVQRALSILGTASLTCASLYLLGFVCEHGIQSVQVGSWPAPFGITFVCDIFSGLMVLVTAIVGFSGALYSLRGIDAGREEFAYHPLMMILFCGILGAFLTGDLFNLYVWFEVLLMSSFVLLSLSEKNDKQQMGGALKYMLLNMLSSTFFLCALGLIYGQTGTLNMADLAVKLHESGQTGLVMSSATLLLLAFGIKAAVFPLFFWLPASYHTAPPVISAVFAGLLTKVGVYALIRVFTLVFPFDGFWLQHLLLFISAATMFVGVLGAASQMNFRRILSFHSISQIGYMTFGLALFSPLAIASSVFYIFHHTVVKTNLFYIGGIVEHITGSESLKKQGSLYSSYPLLSFLFLILAMSLAGVPPLSGFFAKLFVIKAALDVKSYCCAFVALLVGLLTLFSMSKIWAESFWKKNPDARSLAKYRPAPSSLLITVAFLAAIMLCLSFASGYAFDLARRAAEDLLNPDAYIRKVLHGTKMLPGAMV